MLRGARFRCPNCGAKSLFTSYLRVADECAACGEELHHQRADDAPPYFTIVIVGHVIVPLLMALELSFAPPIWVHLAIWLPLAVLMCLLLLPRIKGAIVGLQWALRMHGFDKQGGEDASEAGDSHGSPVVKAQILPT
jgi:uncharacterized protein (DUF983 family)